MDRTSQWLHGFLDLCVLALLDVEPDYGYGLSQRLAKAGFGDVPGGTLYPALLRLERQGLLSSSWSVSDSGPRRKYYEPTDDGRTAVRESAAGWQKFRDAVDGVVGSVGSVGSATEGGRR